MSLLRNSSDVTNFLLPLCRIHQALYLAKFQELCWVPHALPPPSMTGPCQIESKDSITSDIFLCKPYQRRRTKSTEFGILDALYAKLELPLHEENKYWWQILCKNLLQILL